MSPSVAAGGPGGAGAAAPRCGNAAVETGEADTPRGVMTKNAESKTVQVCSGNVASLSVPIVEQ